MSPKKICRLFNSTVSNLRKKCIIFMYIYIYNRSLSKYINHLYQTLQLLSLFRYTIKINYGNILLLAHQNIKDKHIYYSMHLHYNIICSFMFTFLLDVLLLNF